MTKITEFETNDPNEARKQAAINLLYNLPNAHQFMCFMWDEKEYTTVAFLGGLSQEQVVDTLEDVIKQLKTGVGIIPPEDRK